MPHDSIQGQGQGHGGPKLAKMADFMKVHLLRQCACNQKVVNYDTLRQYIYFFPDRFMKFILVQRRVTFKVTVLRGVVRQSLSRTELIFLVHCILLLILNSTVCCVNRRAICTVVPHVRNALYS